MKEFMSKVLSFFVCILGLFMASCKSNYPVAQQSGKEDIAYLLFVSKGGEYKNQVVTVNVDDLQYEAKVVKQKTSNRKGTQYTAPTGNHQLTVSKGGKTLYSKRIFLSAQEVKTILLQ